VDVRLTAVFLGRVLMGLVAVGHGRMVVLVPVAGGQVRPVLAAAEIVGHMGMFVVVDLGMVAVLLAYGQALLPLDNRPICCSRVGKSLTSPLSLASESLLLPESEESLSSPLSHLESEESASSPWSPSLTVAHPAHGPGLVLDLFILKLDDVHSHGGTSSASRPVLPAPKGDRDTSIPRFPSPLTGMGPDRSPAFVSPGGKWWSSRALLLDELGLDLQADRLGEQPAACLQGGVPGQAPVLPVDLGHHA
jgi:hypothetical protein